MGKRMGARRGFVGLAIVVATAFCIAGGMAFTAFTGPQPAYGQDMTVGATSLTAQEDPVSYWYYDNEGKLHEDGSCTEYARVDSTVTAWADGWYVVSESAEIEGRITVKGAVNLILCDGATLTAKKGITVEENEGSNTLTIYAQSEGANAGALVANGASGSGYGAGIGGQTTGPDVETTGNAGTVIIHGGAVTASGGVGSTAAGIGGSRRDTGKTNGNGGTVIIYGGTVIADGGSPSQNATGGAGIGGGGFGGSGGTVTIYGGTVTATGGQGKDNHGGAGIGGGGFNGNYGGSGGTVTIYGGTVTATGAGADTGANSARGIGSGSNNGSGVVDGTVTIGNGVTVKAGDNEDHAEVVSDFDDFATNHPQKWVHAEKKVSYSVTLAGGANAKANPAAGTSQTAVTGAMETVTYTANEGYYFEKFADITSNGIIATWTSDTTVKVSGAPTADVSITVPSAVKKQVAVVTKAPTAKSLTYSGSAQGLVTAGTANGGTMRYALGANASAAPTTGWSASVPTATAAGVYYVWYKAVGDSTHVDSGAAYVNVDIGKASIANASVTLAQASYTYDGNAKKPAVKSVALGGKELKAGSDYTVSYGNNVNAGSATVTVTGKGNYAGTASAGFAIKKASIAKANVTLKKTSYAYDGTPKKPAAKVALNSKTLKAGTDYKIAYKNNKKAGTATVTVTGKGNYAGTAKASFTIKRVSIAKAKVKLAKTSYAYDGKVKKPKVKSVTLNGKKLKAGTDYKVAYKNNKKPGKATVTVTGKGNYKGAVKAKFTIKKVKKSSKLSATASAGGSSPAQGSGLMAAGI